MKKFLFVFSLALITFFLSVQTTNAAILFQDDFSGTDGTLLSDHNSAWALTPGSLTGTLSSNLLNASHNEDGYVSYYLSDFASETDQCVSADVQVFPDSVYSLLVRTDLTPDVLTHGYELAIYGSGLVATFSHGNWRDQYHTTNYTFTTGSWYNAKICAIGTTVTSYINGTQVLSFTDTDASEGMQSFWISTAQHLRLEGFMNNFILSNTLTVNQPPHVSTISASVDPVLVNATTSASVTFTDNDPSDTHTATWTWGDGTTSSGVVTENNESGTITGSHQYTQAGVYAIKVTVTDSDGAITISEPFQYLVVYDPSAGFFTGAGRYESQAGWHIDDAQATGDVRFGLNVRYIGEDTVPTSGSVKFNFRDGNIDFIATSYDWLVVSGSKATLKGKGNLNGSGNYSFIVSAIDGEQAGSVDKVRIKVLNPSNTVIYDTQQGAAETADPTTSLITGKVKVH